ncbi:class I SAM-dependent methyltransferase [Mechercharimyces sp. CAU 1602]|uniref:class I SAM-dependent methyltransferase n=1 Tax=Mechercharimyces sp. CAU 1602 TaxID=2973933 RepID=UPI002162C4B9|nr:class I SAM-dependent methyltransferase [Mechercharimyces sp. CAU 1602]MCS1350130.1 class I SAM-dependent methyltransferase [Mechercharimyces sp. CAU 1602]
MSGQPRFNDIFEDWAEKYDQEISGGNPQYEEVFAGYATILETVVDSLEAPRGGTVMEIGVGTGNLSQVILNKGFQVIGVEPSTQMQKLAAQKVPAMDLRAGHFLDLPDTTPLDGIVSTYAFHHLTDEEKDDSIRQMAERLKPNAKIVFADTAFRDEAHYLEMVAEARANGFNDLADDLEREYYPVLPRLEQSFERAGLRVQFKALNRYVWLMIASKN